MILSQAGEVWRLPAPHGIPHGIRVDGCAPETMLILASPGTEFVGMVERSCIQA